MNWDKQKLKIKCLFGHHPWQTGVWLRRCHICNTVEIEIDIFDVWIPITTKSEYRIIRNIIVNDPTKLPCTTVDPIDKEIFDSLSIEMFND